MNHKQTQKTLQEIQQDLDTMSRMLASAPKASEMVGIAKKITEIFEKTKTFSPSKEWGEEDQNTVLCSLAHINVILDLLKEQSLTISQDLKSLGTQNLILKSYITPPSNRDHSPTSVEAESRKKHE